MKKYINIRIEKFVNDKSRKLFNEKLEKFLRKYSDGHDFFWMYALDPDPMDESKEYKLIRQKADKFWAFLDKHKEEL